MSYIEQDDAPRLPPRSCPCRSRDGLRRITPDRKWDYRSRRRPGRYSRADVERCGHVCALSNNSRRRRLRDLWRRTSARNARRGNLRNRSHPAPRWSCASGGHVHRVMAVEEPPLLGNPATASSSLVALRCPRERAGRPDGRQRRLPAPVSEIGMQAAVAWASRECRPSYPAAFSGRTVIMDSKLLAGFG
jgi:hypothetical protein